MFKSMNFESLKKIVIDKVKKRKNYRIYVIGILGR